MEISTFAICVIAIAIASIKITDKIILYKKYNQEKDKFQEWLKDE